jgi:hypothetical protein
MAPTNQVDTDTMNTDVLYQRIGEFVVSFQWLENRIRETGWLILDSNRHNWPPKELRDLRNEELVNRVETLYLQLLNKLNVEDRRKSKAEFRALMKECHVMRKYRNNLLHSAFIELKAGEDVIGVLRSNPKLKVDPNTGAALLDQEMLTEESIALRMTRLAELGFLLNLHYTQLIHWAPFDKA